MKKTILALALLAGLTSFAGNAKADISYFNTPLTLSPAGGSAYFTTDGTSLFVSSSGNYSTNLSLQNYYSTLYFNPSFTTSPVPSGYVISSTSTLTSFNTATPSSGYYGFAINLGSGNYDYGWVNLSGSDYTVLSAALNTTPNQSILAGQTAVPEPSSYALLGLGALALVIAARPKAA
jgi:hypothetical protein